MNRDLIEENAQLLLYAFDNQGVEFTSGYAQIEWKKSDVREAAILLGIIPKGTKKDILKQMISYYETHPTKYDSFWNKNDEEEIHNRVEGFLSNLKKNVFL
jgi:hypothetical protein